MSQLILTRNALKSQQFFGSHFLMKLNYRYCHHSANDLVICKDEAGIRFITLNNPKQRNILSWNLLQSLKKCISEGMSANVPPVTCIVLRAEGNVFSAGHDLKELEATNKENHVKLFDLCAEVMMSLRNIPVPVIAQVKGLATAAGCQLAASADIVVAGESAKFSTPGVNIGLFCSTPGIALVRTVSAKAAAYMLYTGLPITAKEAYQYGLVSRLVPDDKVEEETMAIARAIGEKSRPVQNLGKRFLNKQINMTLPDAYREGSKVMSENLTYKDAQNGIQSFRKKQHPTWSHTPEKY